MAGAPPAPAPAPAPALAPATAATRSMLTAAMSAAPDPHRLEELRAEAAHRRRKVDLYAARSYGPRPTSPTRMRELVREADAAEARLAAALARSRA